MWTLYWSINGSQGHGSPIGDWFAAKAWLDRGNKEHGAGTHWLGAA